MKRLEFISLVALFSISVGQWSSSPDEPITLGDGVQAQIKPTSDGGVYVAWLSEGNFNVYLQRLNSLGEPEWADGGLIVSDQPNSSWIAVHHMNLSVDGNDNAIISTLDTRTGMWQVYAYKIAPDGSMLWGDDGLSLSVSGSENISPRLTVLSDNSAVVAWCQNYMTVRLQKISESGSLEWGDGGIHIVDGTGDLLNPLPLTVDGSNVLIQWNHQSGPFWAPDTKLYLQKFNSSGVELWDSPVVVVGPVVFPTGNYFQESSEDGVGGSFSAWTEMSGANQSAVAQRISSNGEIVWEDGVDFSTNTGHFRTNPRTAVSEGTSEIMSVWTQTNGGQSQHGIYAQKLDENGSRLWGSYGVAVVPLNGNYSYLDVSVESFGDDMVTAYIEQSNNMTGDIYASRLNSNGEFVWFGQTVALTSSGNSKSDMSVNRGPGCMFVVWTENGSVQAHCLLENGTLGAPAPQEIELVVLNSVGWNIVGIPIDTDPVSYLSVYPEAVNGTFYGFDGFYTSAENLVVGDGFWLRFNSENMTTITGLPLEQLAIDLNEGWNLISGISSPVNIIDIEDNAGIIFSGTIYGFTYGGYSNPDQLEPGKGYWIRSNSSGTIVIHN